MFLQTNFSLSRCFENLGYDIVEKSNEMLAQKGGVSIYFHVGDKHTRECFIDMVVLEGDECVYKGVAPMSEELLMSLLELLFPSDTLIKEIDEHMHESMVRSHIS